MKKFYSLLLIAFFISCASVTAQDKPFSAGISIGEPTGLSGSYIINDKKLISAKMGYSLILADGFYLSADYLTRSGYLLPVKEADIPLYYGFGVTMKGSAKDDKLGLGARGVAAVSWFYDSNLEFFYDLAPVFVLLPSVGINLETSLSARYYFNFR